MTTGTVGVGAVEVAAPALSQPQRLYLDLLKRSLTRFDIGRESWQPVEPRRGTALRAVYAPLRAGLARLGLRLVRSVPFDPGKREVGLDWPAEAETMVGLKRLDNLQALVVDVASRGVPGDLVETGVWRGGASIFMRGVLKALGDGERRVWACDSFQGLPRPRPEVYEADAGDAHWTVAELAVPLEEVKANFARYGLLDEQVEFLPGWFHETLPDAPIRQIGLLRLDGDMYESTHVALEALYPRVAEGGYVVVDDYGAIPACRRAVDDYRETHQVTAPLNEIDWTGVYWRKAR